MALSPQQEQFALWYVRRSNARWAAIKAGCPEAGAHTTASRWLQDEEVAALIAAERAVIADKLRVTPERITAALAAMAFGDTRDIVSWDDEGLAIVTASDDLHEHQAMMVEGVVRKDRVDKDGNRDSTLELKFSSRQGAIDKLARIQGLYKDKLEITDGDGLAAKLEAKRIARAAARGVVASTTTTTAEEGDSDA